MIPVLWRYGSFGLKFFQVRIPALTLLSAPERWVIYTFYPKFYVKFFAFAT